MQNIVDQIEVPADQANDLDSLIESAEEMLEQLSKENEVKMSELKPQLQLLSDDQSQNLDGIEMDKRYLLSDTMKTYFSNASWPSE